MLSSCFCKGVNSIEKEVYDVLRSGKSKWQNNWDLILFLSLCVCALCWQRKKRRSSTQICYKWLPLRSRPGGGRGKTSSFYLLHCSFLKTFYKLTCSTRNLKKITIGEFTRNKSLNCTLKVSELHGI